MHNPAQMMAEREIAQYKNALGDWARRVRAQRQARIAFQQASHAPQPGALARSLKHLANSDRMRAERQIEEHLEGLAEEVDPTHPEFVVLMRLSQGHWPRLYRKLEERLRKSASK